MFTTKFNTKAMVSAPSIDSARLNDNGPIRTPAVDSATAFCATGAISKPRPDNNYPDDVAGERMTTSELQASIRKLQRELSTSFYSTSTPLTPLIAPYGGKSGQNVSVNGGIYAEAFRPAPDHQPGAPVASSKDNKKGTRRKNANTTKRRNNRASRGAPSWSQKVRGRGGAGTGKQISSFMRPTASFTEAIRRRREKEASLTAPKRKRNRRGKPEVVHVMMQNMEYQRQKPNSSRTLGTSRHGRPPSILHGASILRQQGQGYQGMRSLLGSSSIPFAVPASQTPVPMIPPFEGRTMLRTDGTVSMGAGAEAADAHYDNIGAPGTHPSSPSSSSTATGVGVVGHRKPMKIDDIATSSGLKIPSGLSLSHSKFVEQEQQDEKQDGGRLEERGLSQSGLEDNDKDSSEDEGLFDLGLGLDPELGLPRSILKKICALSPAEAAKGEGEKHSVDMAEAAPRKKDDYVVRMETANAMLRNSVHRLRGAVRREAERGSRLERELIEAHADAELREETSKRRARQVLQLYEGIQTKAKRLNEANRELVERADNLQRRVVLEEGRRLRAEATHRTRMKEYEREKSILFDRIARMERTLKHSGLCQ